MTSAGDGHWRDAHRSSGNLRTRVAVPAPSGTLVPTPTPWRNWSDEFDSNFANDEEPRTPEALSSFLSHPLNFVITFAATPGGPRALSTGDGGMENRMWRSWCGRFVLASSPVLPLFFALTWMTLSVFDFFSAA